MNRRLETLDKNLEEATARIRQLQRQLAEMKLVATKLELREREIARV